MRVYATNTDESWTEAAGHRRGNNNATIENQETVQSRMTDQFAASTPEDSPKR